MSALIVPVYGFVKDYAKEKGIEYKNMEELLQHPKILGLFRARIDTLQQQFAHYEQVKRFTLLPEPFSTVSYTHLDVYKRQLSFCSLKRQMPPGPPLKPIQIYPLESCNAQFTRFPGMRPVCEVAV